MCIDALLMGNFSFQIHWGLLVVWLQARRWAASRGEPCCSARTTGAPDWPPGRWAGGTARPSPRPPCGSIPVSECIRRRPVFCVIFSDRFLLSDAGFFFVSVTCCCCRRNAGVGQVDYRVCPFFCRKMVCDFFFHLGKQRQTAALMVCDT